MWVSNFTYIRYLCLFLFIVHRIDWSKSMLKIRFNYVNDTNQVENEINAKKFVDGQIAYLMSSLFVRNAARPGLIWLGIVVETINNKSETLQKCQVLFKSRNYNNFEIIVIFFIFWIENGKYGFWRNSTRKSYANERTRYQTNYASLSNGCVAMSLGSC